jgi:tRNA(His) 5'-end guanylyltransferase
MGETPFDWAAREARMRRGELFHALRVPDDCWIIIRVDGRSFHAYARKYERPFDPRFHEHMLAAAEALVEAFAAPLAYTESDEISMVLRPEWELYDRELEKLVSLTAATTASAFAVSSGDPVAFDSRVCVYPRLETVLDYLLWRQDDCWRCCVNGWAYWTARKEGLDNQRATALVEGPAQRKHDFLHERGINVAEVPAWQRRGSCIVRETYQREGYNPKTGESAQATRRRLARREDLPRGEEFRAFCCQALGEPLLTT